MRLGAPGRQMQVFVHSMKPSKLSYGMHLATRHPNASKPYASLASFGTPGDVTFSKYSFLFFLRTHILELAHAFQIQAQEHKNAGDAMVPEHDAACSRKIALVAINSNVKILLTS